MGAPGPQEGVGQNVTVIHERLSLTTRKPVEVSANSLNALDHAGRWAYGFADELAVPVSLIGWKPVDIAAESNK